MFTERRGGHDAPVPTLLGASRRLPPRGCTTAENVGSTREPQRRPAPARPLAALPRLPRPIHRRGRRLERQQGRGRGAGAADRCGGRRRRPRRRVVRRRGAGCRVEIRAAGLDRGRQRGRLDHRVRLRVRRQRAVARARAGRRARPARRGLRPRPAPRPGLARDPTRGGDPGHAQRRRQPARALPRHRCPGDPADHAQRAARRRGVRRGVGPAAGAGVPAHPADRHRLARLPASPRAALRPGPQRRRRPLRDPQRQPGGHRDHQGVHRREPRA